MNNEQVMQLMADNGMHEGGMDNWVIDNAWVKFANLVAAQEREECWRTAENYDTGYEAAEAIRARGNT